MTNGPNPLLHTLTVTAKDKLNKMYNKLSIDSWNSTVAKLDIENDSRNFFQTVKRLQGYSKTKNIDLRDDNNSPIPDDPEKELHFRHYWTQIFRNDQEDHLFCETHIKNIEGTISQNKTLIDPLPLSDPLHLPPEYPPITMAELSLATNRIKHKAPGPSGITAYHMKNLPNNMLISLKNIMNHALSLGYFPKAWKHATMIFIPKGNSSQAQVANHRPISLLEVPGKLFDRHINTRLTNHLQANGLEHPDQHGFRKVRGTHTALATFHETIANTVHAHQGAKNARITVTLRDVSKAFDKVWTNGLKYKLLRLQIHPLFTKILCNFISDRTASIRINQHTGSPFPLRSGVPQGACLSPSLYNFYTSDLPNPHSDKGNTQNILYADDITQITTSRGRQNPHHQSHTENAITQVNNFEKSWKIKTNTKKFQAIPILTKPNLPPLKIDNQPIQLSSKGKTLGLTFNKKGYGPHVTQSIANCNNKLNKMRRFSKLSPKNRIRLYKTCILPSLIYPSVPLHTVPKSQLKKLQTFQNKALRFATRPSNTAFPRRLTCIELHEKANIDPINTMLHRHAKKTWNTLKDYHPLLYQKLKDSAPITPNNRRKDLFVSSRTLAEADSPDPIFTFFPRRGPP